MARRGENIYKRKDGRWEGRYRCGTALNGNVKYRSIYGKTYQEVKEKLFEFRSSGILYAPSGSLTVKELFTEWLNAVKLKVKESSYANYLMKVNKHILPEFGGYLYEKLTSKSIHCFIEKKIRQGLSTKYVADIIVVFKSMAKYISREHGYSNPLENVIMPKAKKKTIQMLNDEEQRTLFQFLNKNLGTTELCIILSCYTGLRIGEICGLKWNDIDLENGLLTVRRTVQRISKRNGNMKTQIIVGTPKSDSSSREIPIPPFLLSILKLYANKPSDYVLSGNSSIVEPRTLQYRFKAILKKANLPSINYHSLRHMFASNCVKIGFDVKTLSEILGHSSVEITLNRYVHSTMERKFACMNLLKAAA